MNKGEEVLISVIIPVKNGDVWIDQCIRGIMDQTLYHQTEIILIDSGSTDNTIAIAEKYPVQLFRIPPHEFNHGLTRNYGVSLTKGKYVVMTVQDSTPVDNTWLEKLLAGFSDESVAGVCGRQAVRHDPANNPVDWYKPASAQVIRKYSFQSPAEFERLTPAEKKAACSWDNVTAMYRRDLLLKIPFTKAVFAEDIIWAKQVLLAGYSIVYNPMARVYHYHFENPEYIFKRTLTTFYFRYKYLGIIPVRNYQSLKSKLSMAKTILQAAGVSVAGKLTWWKYNLRRLKVIDQAFYTFTNALSKGEEELDNIHEKFCGSAPVPPKRR